MAPPAEVADRARALAATGVAGLFTFEGPHDVFLPLALAAGVAPVDLMTNVAIAFPRSPVHLAHAAWDLQALSGGRFRLGLGSQVRAHVERRYGATWSHAAAVPIPGQLGAPTGKLHVTFRLDSLSRYGDVAYISMSGTVARPKSGAGGGMTYESDGTVVGALEMDRRRGWLTSMRATITTKSAVTQDLGAQPVHVRTKITQWMRVIDPVDRD
jgi:hypothetical protein